MDKDEAMKLQVIAHLRGGFSDKFGIPRQSGLVPEVMSTIVFEPPFRSEDALRGIEGYSHLWLIWGFSENKHESHALTVRPPRLGGNERMGVFSTRSPYRPNPVGLSSVTLIGVERTASEGLSLIVSGADLLDGTPIYDIKPYLAFTDSHPDAKEGFAGEKKADNLSVYIPDALVSKIPEMHRTAIKKLLAEDPRPAYQEDATRVYGLSYQGMDIRFTVNEDRLVVSDIVLL